MRRLQILSALSFGFLLFTSSTNTAFADAKSKVFLNGVPSIVHFNDGDSFAVLSGPHAGTRGRLAGFNTLESYGPVHQWGTWTAHELYVLAKKGTLNARRGVWHCTSDLKKDGYGRTLWDCPDLAVDQIRKGFAHGLTVTKDPSPPELLKAQKEAIAAKRGIWAHGVPEYILTSTHSANESAGTWDVYNRLVSSADGHSEKWHHRDVYEECENVCQMTAPVDDQWIQAAQKLLPEAIQDEKLKTHISEMNEAQVTQMLKDYLVLGFSDLVDEVELREVFLSEMSRLQEEGQIAKVERSKGACMIYVDYRRRFGLRRAQCLKH